MNLNFLTEAFPNSKVNQFLPFFENAFSYADISTPERMFMFFANVGHECGDFTKFEESFNYRPKRLAEVWPGRYAINPKEKDIKKRQPNAKAFEIAKKPEVIANLTYANRNGNGSIESGDGYRYRGRGLIMLTGRGNYKDFDNEFHMNGKIVANPDMVVDPYWAVMTAASFWKRKKLNEPADAVAIKEARRIVNGGEVGLSEVYLLYNRIKFLYQNQK